MRRFAVAVLLACSCSPDSFGSGDSGADAASDGSKDALVDAPDARVSCPATAKWGAAVKVDGISDELGLGLALSDDERVAYFGRRPGPGSRYRLYRAERASVSEPFANVTLVDVGAGDGGAPWSDIPSALSLDGKDLYFVSTRNNGVEQVLVSPSSGGTPQALFGLPPPVAPSVVWTFVSFASGANGAEIYFSAQVGDAGTAGAIGGGKLSSRTIATDTYSISGINGVAGTTSFRPVVSRDGSYLYFSTNRLRDGGGGVDQQDVWQAVRSGTTWTVSVVDELLDTAGTVAEWLSPDGCRLYVNRATGTERDYFVVQRSP